MEATQGITPVIEHARRKERDEQVASQDKYCKLLVDMVDGKEVDPERAWKIIQAAGIAVDQVEADCRHLEKRRTISANRETAISQRKERAEKEPQLYALREEYRAELQRIRDKYQPTEDELRFRVEFLSNATGPEFFERQLIETCWPAEREALDTWEARYNPILARWQGCREHAQEYGSTDEPNASRMKALEVELERLREERRVIHQACLEP